MNWISTHEQLPEEGRVVLGWWAEYAIGTVIRHGKDWNATAYRFSEYRSVPLFWAHLPERPVVEKRTA